MIQKIKSYWKGLSIIVASPALIIWGADHLIEDGERNATEAYQVQIIQDLTDRLAECE